MYPLSPSTNAQQVAIANRQHLYSLSKAAKVGETCKCPSCVKLFVKKSYQQAFCCNKGSGNCKDSYWNSVDPNRAARAGIVL